MERQHAAIEQDRRVKPAASRPAHARGAGGSHHLQRMVGNQGLGMFAGEMRAGGMLVQTKLTIGAPGDRYEQEADRVAEQIVSGAASGGPGAPGDAAGPGTSSAFLSDGAGAVRRSCAACSAGASPCPSCEGEDEKVRRMPAPPVITPISQHSAYSSLQRAGDTGPGGDIDREQEEEMVQSKESPGVVPAVTTQQEGAIASLRGGGEPLSADVRGWIEPRFGRDFGSVRIHRDERAAESARSIGARAYTIGRDVVFGAGEYNPGSMEGKRLLAHELTHVVQQGSSSTGERIQRTSDYNITGLYPDAASFPNIIFFNRGSFNIPPSEQGKIAALATPASRNLTLHGFTSEDGSAAGNATIINARINRVSAELGSAGHTATRTANPQPTAGEGQIDYRRMRAVEVVPTPAVGPAPTSQPRCQVTVAVPHPEVTPCGASFTTAHPLATTMLTNALTEVNGPSATATTQMSALFPGVATATIQSGLSSLQTQLGVMTVRHQCHNTCDAGCNRPGYNNGSGPTAMMTLCPDFINGTSANENALLLLHEGLHATVGVTAIDVAYRSSRMITNISGAQAATNTDSWVLLILRLNSGIAASGPPTDNFTGMTAAEQAQAREALAFLESWMLTAEFDTSILYDAIKRNVGRVGGWAAADNFNAGTMHVIGWLFGLTDPGSAPPYTTPPTREDQINIAGIYDRYTRMRQALWTRNITINKVAAGPEAWAANLGNSVNVDSTFFGLTQTGRVLRLLRLMIKAMPDIPSARETAYAEGANQMRWHRGGIGP